MNAWYLPMALVTLAALISTPLAAVEPGHEDHDHEHRQHGAHVHGMASLKIAIEDQSVSIELESPAVNLVGFEHPPENADEQRRVAETLVALGDYRNLLTLKGGACSQAEADVHSPLAKQVGELAHSPADEKEHEDEAHADFDAGYQLKCPSATEIEAIELTLFDRFPGFEKVKVDWVGPTGQGSKEATKTDALVRLK